MEDKWKPPWPWKPPYRDIPGRLGRLGASSVSHRNSPGVLEDGEPTLEIALIQEGILWQLENTQFFWERKSFMFEESTHGIYRNYWIYDSRVIFFLENKYGEIRYAMFRFPLDWQCAVVSRCLCMV